MKKFPITFFFISTILFFCSLLYSHKFSIFNFQGRLDKQGSVSVPHSIDINDSIFVQGFIFYLKNWRSISVFFNTSHVWVDMGPYYKKLPYRIHIFLSDVPTIPYSNPIDNMSDNISLDVEIK